MRSEKKPARETGRQNRDARFDVFDALDLAMIAAVQSGLILPDKINGERATYSSETAFRFVNRFTQLLCEKFGCDSADQMWSILADHKSASSYGRLWGWPNAEDEKAYVQRRAKDFQATDAPGAVVAYSQLIEYPEEGLQCIQTETWVRMKK